MTSELGDEVRAARIGRGIGDGMAHPGLVAVRARGGGEARVDAAQRAPVGLVQAVLGAVGRSVRERFQRRAHVHHALGLGQLGAELVHFGLVEVERHGRLALHGLQRHLGR